MKCQSLFCPRGAEPKPDACVNISPNIFGINLVHTLLLHNECNDVYFVVNQIIGPLLTMFMQLIFVQVSPI